MYILSEYYILLNLEKKKQELVVFNITNWYKRNPFWMRSMLLQLLKI